MKREQLKYTYPENDRIFDVQENVEYHVVTRISDFFIENNELCFETSQLDYQKATLRVSVVNDDIVRVKYSQKYFPTNKFSDHIELKSTKLPFYRVVEKEYDVVDAAEVKTSYFTGNHGSVGAKRKVKQYEIPFKDKLFVISTNPFNLEIKNKKGEIQFTLNWREGFKYFGGYTAPGLGFKQMGDASNHPFLSWAIGNEEHFYGLGEKFGKFEKTNTRKTIWNSDTSGKSNSDLSYNALPYVLSSNNWGLLVDTGSKTQFDIGASVVDAGSLLTSDEHLDLYFFAGDNLKDLINSYTDLTGKIKGIHDKAYSVWFSRLYYFDRKDVETELANAEKHHVPMDVAHIDPKWMKNRYTKSCNFVEADERFGDFKKFFADMNKKDLSISFWLNPYIQSDDSKFWKEAHSKGYLVKSTEREFAHPYTGVETYQENNFIIDFTNKEAYTWWKKHVIALAKKGLLFTVPDYGDGVPADALFANGKTGKEMRMYFTYLYKKCVFEAISEVYGKENVANISRPGYIGSQKFPGKWGGDSGCRWSELKNSIQAGLSMSMNGEVLWGTDIGGFIGQPVEKLYNRWVQYGSFTPFTRLHGLTKREPWYFSKEAVTNAKKYFELKRQWLPMYKIGELEAIKTGTPIMRPLVLEFQDDMFAREIDTQYMILDNVMIAPFITEKDTRQIYMPKGKWVNLFNKKEYTGKQAIEFTDSNDMPIFVKDESLLITFKNGNFKWKDISKQELVINIINNHNKDLDITKSFKLNNKEIKVHVTSSKNKYNVKVTGWTKYSHNVF